jgi:16S rRNA (guanine527-N7)-methyltransferase
MNKEEFISELKELNISITEEQMLQLDKYYKMILEYNQKINLTNITEEKEVYLKHFYDSLTLVKAYDLNQNLKVCDIGTGAGFPGIVLKILFPNLDIVLIDSLNKRIEFLKLVIKELNLEKIEAIHTRAEDYARLHREELDLVTSRAVANLEVLSELCLPLVKVNGYFIAMKAHVDNEVKESETILKKLFSVIENIIEFELPNLTGHRTLIKIRKEKETNKLYPRDYRIIKKTLKNK